MPQGLSDISALASLEAAIGLQATISGVGEVEVPALDRLVATGVYFSRRNAESRSPPLTRIVWAGCRLARTGMPDTEASAALMLH